MLRNRIKKIISISINTFREAIRDKILYTLFGFGFFLILADLFLAKVSLGDMAMIKSFGLAGLYFFGLVISVFLGASIIYKEIEKRTLYFVLSKPVSRFDVVIGKFLGLFSAIFLTTSLMAIVYLLVIFYESKAFDYLGSLAIILQFAEQALLVSLLIFFSSFMSPLTATLSAIIVIFTGHLLEAVLASAEMIGGSIYIMAKSFYYFMPNLAKFDIRNLVVHNITIAQSEFWTAIGYSATYSALLIIVASLIFRKREL